MGLNEEKEIQDMLMEELKRDPQRPSIIRAWPAAGMSAINLSWLLKLPEKAEEQ